MCEGTGDWVFYWGQTAGGGSYLFKMAIVGGDPVRVSERLALSPPFLSPDGRHIAFANQKKNGGVEIAVISSATGALEAEQPVPPAFDQTSRAVTWMPDNASLAFADTRTGTPNLWSMPMFHTGPQQQLTHFTSGILYDAHFSRDGKSLILAKGTKLSDVVLFTTPK